MPKKPRFQRGKCLHLAEEQKGELEWLHLANDTRGVQWLHLDEAPVTEHSTVYTTLPCSRARRSFLG